MNVHRWLAGGRRCWVWLLRHCPGFARRSAHAQFLAGFAAFHQGRSLGHNPHPSRTAHDAWMRWRRGFLAAQARSERRGARHRDGFTDRDTDTGLYVIASQHADDHS